MNIQKKVFASLMVSCLFVAITDGVSKKEKSKEQEEKKKKIEALSNEEYVKEFDKEVFSWSKTIAESLELIKSRYYLKVDIEQALIDAINTLVSRDPHTMLLDPKAFEDMTQSTRGEFYGIGIVIDNLKEADDDALTVIDTIPGGPADTVGMLPDDKIVQVNEEAVKGMAVDEIVTKLKGKRNTTVHVKVLRKGQPGMLSFDITRDVVKEQNAVCFHFTDHDIYYLSLNMFTNNSIKQLGDLLRKSQQESKGLILDLRFNSGGLLDAAIKIVSLFVPNKSVVVTTKDRNDKVIETYYTQGKPITNSQIPIFILVNNYTASAAEILAGCLQVHANAQPKNKACTPTFVVGTKTFGKGSVQELIPISNDCALKLTTALYYLPNNVSIQGIGVQPDFIVEQKYPPTTELKWVEDFFGYESSLKKSIKPKQPIAVSKDVDKKDEKKKTWEERKIERIGNDHQILSTIRLIEMFNLAKVAQPELCHDRNTIITFLNKHFNPQAMVTMKQVTLQ